MAGGVQIFIHPGVTGRDARLACAEAALRANGLTVVRASQLAPGPLLSVDGVWLGARRVDVVLRDDQPKEPR